MAAPFDPLVRHAKFFQDTRRALRPDGIIAAWTYDWPWTQIAAIDLILRRLKEDILGPFGARMLRSIEIVCLAERWKRRLTPKERPDLG